MKIHVKDENSYLYDVINLDDNKRISGVQWADDEMGTYEVYDGISKNHLLNYKYMIKKGNIKIVRNNNKLEKDNNKAEEKFFKSLHKKSNVNIIRYFKSKTIQLCYALSDFFDKVADKIGNLE